MASKQFMLDGNTPVNIYKHKRSRSLRLSITPAGEVRVSIPTWAPYSAGVNFAKSRRSWIVEQRRGQGGLMQDGQTVGKAHHLHFMVKTGLKRPASRVAGGTVLISYPPELTPADPAVQQAAQNGSIRALRAQAEQLLPQRLKLLADKHGFDYGSVSVKRLKSRWGSCDQHKNIVLNLFLMQLPWEYIDYVLLHELTHTRVMRHGPDFWAAMKAVQPQALDLRKRLRQHQPVLDTAPAAADVA